MNILKKLSLAAISFVIYVSVPTLLLLSVFQSVIFEDKVISNSMEKTGLYERTTEGLVSDLTVTRENFINEESEAYKRAPEKVNAKVDQYVSTINGIIEETVTTEWMKQKFLGLEEEILLAIKGEENINLTINIANLKEDILVKFDASFTEEEKNEEFHQEVRASLSKTPTTIDVKEAGLNTSGIEMLQTYYKEYNQNNLMVSGALILLFIIGSFIAFKLGETFRWTGTTITSTGLSIIFYYLGLKYFLTILSKINIAIPSAGGLSSQQIENVMSYITTSLADKLLPYGIAVIVIGLVILVISFVPKFKKQPISEKQAA
ncbi:hypothetical protein CIB95_12340 [Lottiidibacillus patelloidae]|uniref:Uncharacterized protein n=1 Tax=Lottiidibacillus patelloidae TaxID=2670334 RepID=A0A263BR72_9BACI|nr:hypothetical protein [Lottiidibacillus patelloidae]OZM56209.1 hypothetical protein CIB95_12340 [Lottiidibacillus patelloidae]